MDTHIQGPCQGPTLGAILANRSYLIDYSQGATEWVFDWFDGTQVPVYLQIDAYVETAFNATGTDTLVAGNLTTADAYIASGVIVPSTLGWQAGKTVLLRTLEKLTATVGPPAIVQATGTLTSDATAPTSGVSATGIFTPPTSATATCVINGTSFLATFNTNATQTVTDLKALIAADATITALVTTSGTTTLVLTSKTKYASQNAITTTSNAANGASFGAATLTGGANPDSVVIGSVTYYSLTALTTSPATIPNEVLIGGSAAAFLDNLKLAVNAGAGIGTNYSTGTVANPDATATTNTNTTQVFVAIPIGTLGNAVVTTEASSHLSFGSTTMTGGVDLATQGSMQLLVKAYGMGTGIGIAT